MTWDCASACVVLALAYLLFMVHCINARQQRMEEYGMAAVRVATVVAGGAVVSPFLQTWRGMPQTPGRQ